MTLLQKILNAGTSSESNPLNVQYIRITNTINLLYIIGLSIPLILAIILLTLDGINSYGRFILLIVFSLFSLFLNQIHMTRFAKIVTSVTPVFAVIVFPIFINHFIHAGMFLWMPYAIMTIGVIPFFIFSFENEKVIMCSVIGFYLISILFFDELIMQHFNQLADLEFVKKYHLYYILGKIAITILLYSTFFTFKWMYHTNRVTLLKLTEELDQKNQALNILNITLENKVAERTAKLSLQNERIKNLAHTNAHEIRAHIARILGLSNLAKQEISQEEKSYCATKILENISDLDKVTQKLSKELVEEK
jgi:signal transduction histidine kinase